LNLEWQENKFIDLQKKLMQKETPASAGVTVLRSGCFIPA